MDVRHRGTTPTTSAIMHDSEIEPPPAYDSLPDATTRANNHLALVPTAPPITHQPRHSGGGQSHARSAGSMTMLPPQLPPPIPGVPIGLELLSMTGMIFVIQEMEMLEMLTGFETANRYRIVNHQGIPMLYAREINDMCTMNCLGAQRPFDMEVLDLVGRPVMWFSRPKRCSCNCCAGMCGQEINIDVCGSHGGHVTQTASCCESNFIVFGPNQQPMFKIVGPACVMGACGPVEFMVHELGNPNPIGRIAKHWSGFVKEWMSDADNFGIEVPLGMDVRLKAVMLGACILIDYMYFEQAGGNRNRGLGFY